MLCSTRIGSFFEANSFRSPTYPAKNRGSEDSLEPRQV